MTENTTETSVPVLEIPVPVGDRFYQQKTDLLSTIIRSWQDRWSLEGENEKQLLRYEAEEGKELSEDALFEELVKICEVLTMNVLDLYSGKVRDPRRGLFHAHKAILESANLPSFTHRIETRLQECCQCGGTAQDVVDVKMEDIENPFPKQIVVHPSMRRGFTESSGNGLYTVDRVAKDSNLIELHHSCLLNAATAFSDPGFIETAMELRESFDCDEEKIALAYLVYLKRKFRRSNDTPSSTTHADDSTTHGEDADMGATNSVANNEESKDNEAKMRFLVTRCLPADLDECPATLLTWPDEALENLYCPQVLYQVETSRLEMTQLHKSIIKAFSKIPDIGTDPVDLEEVLYARVIFDSRAFNLKMPIGRETERCMDESDDEVEDVKMANADEKEDDDEASEDKQKEVQKGQELLVSVGDKHYAIFLERNLTCLAPIADFLNHSRQSPICVPRYDEDKESLILQTAPEIRSGIEVCLNYGPLQNWELLLYYGFCFDKNTADTLQLELGEPEQEELKDALERLKVTTDHVLAWPEEGTEKGRWPLADKLLVCLRVLHGVMPSDVENCTFSAQSDRSAADLQICDTLLDVFQQLLHPEDEILHKTVMNETNLIWESDPNYGPLAKRFRACQRELVAANIAAVESFREHCFSATKAAQTSKGSANANKNKRRKR